MSKVHGFLNNERVLNQYLNHLPRKGDTIRLDDVTYTKVIEVIWCMDESRVLSEPTRVNLRFEPLKD